MTEETLISKRYKEKQSDLPNDDFYVDSDLSEETCEICGTDNQICREIHINDITALACNDCIRNEISEHFGRKASEPYFTAAMNPETSQEFIKLIKTIANIEGFDIFLELSEQGIRIRGFDATRISYYDLMLSKDFFELYELNYHQFIRLDINVLEVILSTFKEGEELTLSIRDDELNIFCRTIDPDYCRNYRIPANFPSGRLDESVYYNDIHLTTASIFDVHTALNLSELGFLDLKADYVKIETFATETHKEGLKFSLDSKHFDYSEFFSADKLKVFLCDKSIQTVYTLEYLYAFAEYLYKPVLFKFAEDGPLKFVYHVKKGENTVGSLSYYIAPRMADPPDSSLAVEQKCDICREFKPIEQVKLIGTTNICEGCLKDDYYCKNCDDFLNSLSLLAYEGKCVYCGCRNFDLEKEASD